MSPLAFLRSLFLGPPADEDDMRKDVRAAVHTSRNVTTMAVAEAHLAKKVSDRVVHASRTSDRVLHAANQAIARLEASRGSKTCGD